MPSPRSDGSPKRSCCFELFCLIQSLPLGLHDQTDQRIGRRVREKRPVQRNAKVEMKTRKCNRARKFYESQNRLGRAHRWRCGCEGIQCAAAGYEKARTRPHNNSIFHAATPAVLRFNSLTNSSEFQREILGDSRPPGGQFTWTGTPTWTPRLYRSQESLGLRCVIPHLLFDFPMSALIAMQYQRYLAVPCDQRLSLRLHNLMLCGPL